MDDHHTHKHAEEDKGGKQDKDDGERTAQNQIPGIQLLLQVCPAIVRAAFAAINIIKTVNYFGEKEKRSALGNQRKINYS